MEGRERETSQKPHSRKRRIIIGVSVALAIVIVLAVVLAILFKKDDQFIADGQYYTEYLETPEGTPQDYMAAEDGWKNIGYMNYVLQSQPYYYSAMTSNIDLTVLGQKMLQQVETEKQFYEGVLVTTEITTTPVSLFGIKVESATQFCIISNPDIVLWRSSVGGPGTSWSEERPTGLAWSQFRETHGCLQTEFAVYVINRDTILESSAVTLNDDGTYSQTFVLNHEIQPYENSAVYYYQAQMQASGGLSSLPTFSSVEVTYTFDSEWRVLRSDIVESYTASYGPFEAKGVAHSTTTYSYEEDKAQNTVYEDFFKQYENDFGVEAEKTIDAQSCFASAFGEALTGKAALAVDITLKDTTVSGLAQINIEENDIRVNLGDLKVYILPEDAGSVYISYGNDLQIKIPTSSFSANSGISALSQGEQEEGSAIDSLIGDILGGEFSVNDGKTEATLISHAELAGILLDFNFLFDLSGSEANLAELSATVNLFGEVIGASLEITGDSVPALTEAQAAKYVEFDLSSVVNVLSEGISSKHISLSGSVVIPAGEDELKLTLSKLSVDWQEGLKIGARLTVEYGGLTKEVAISYTQENIALYYDGMIIKIAQADVNGFTEAAKLLYSAIAEQGIGGESNSTLPEDRFVDALLELLPQEELSIEDILAVLGNIKLYTEDNNLKIAYEDIYLTFVNGSSNFILNYSGITAELTIEEYGEVTLPQGAVELDAAELIPLMNNVAAILTEKGLTISATLNLNLESTVASLEIYGMYLSWSNGLKLELDARLTVGDSAHDFYVEYDELSGILTIVYGEFDQTPVGVTLSVAEGSGDISTLENALVELYNRIAQTVNTASKDALAPVESLEELLEIIGLGADVAAEAPALFGALGSLDRSNILSILNSIEISGVADGNGTQGIIAFTLGNISLSMWKNTADGAISLSIDANSLAFELNSLKIAAIPGDGLGFDVPDNLLSAQELCELLDYVGAAVEMLAKDTFDIKLTGTVTSTEEAFAQIENNVKYIIDAGFEYVQGEEFPVHVNLGSEDSDPNVWISPDMYAHIYVNMVSTVEEVDSVLFDIYILDGTPELDKDGKTAGAFTENGELDIYMQLSRIPTQGEHHSPLKIYAPVSEITSVAAAGLAIADFGSIQTDIAEINDIITQVADVLDVLLVDKYLGGTKDKFSSFGSSLLESIIGGSLSDLINSLLGGISGGVEGAKEAETPVSARALGEGLTRSRLGALEEFSVTQNGENGNTVLRICANGTTATVTKNNGNGKSLITNLNIDAVALNESDILNSLNIDISYGEIKKVEELAGFTSLAGVNSLLQTVVNSATYEKEEGEYALNNSFFIDGTLSMSASLAGWELVGHEIVIDGFNISFDENGEIEVNARLHYNGAGTILLIVPVTAVNGASTLDLTIKNGMVYMKRVQTTRQTGRSSSNITPETIYRAMPLDVFTGDILNQIGFMLNFSDTMLSLFNLGGDDDGPRVDYKQDYGEQFGDYFNFLKFNKDEENGTASWDVEINGTGLSDLAGIDLSDIGVTLNAVEDESGYLLTNLGLTASLFGMVGIEGDLNWRNPQMNWRVISTEENEDGTVTQITAQPTAKDIIENNPSIKLTKWLGGSTYKEICKVINWNSLPATSKVETENENGETVETTYHYFELTFTGESETPSGTLKFGKAEYYVMSGTGADAEEILLSSVENILYSGTTLLSIVKVPDLTEYAKEHYTFEWKVSSVSGGLKYVAQYIPEVYEVTFTSEYEIEGYLHIYGEELKFDFTYETDGHKIDYIEYKGERYNAENYTYLIIDGDAEIYVHWVEVPSITVKYYSAVQYAGSSQVSGINGYEMAYGSTVKLSSNLSVANAFVEGYMFLGWFYLNGEEWIIVYDVMQDIPNADYGNTYELHALWLKATISITSTKGSGNIITGYSYTISNVGVEFEFYGHKDLLEEISITDMKFGYYMNGNGNYGTSINTTVDIADISCENGVYSAKDTQNRTFSRVSNNYYGNVNVSFNINIGETTKSCSGTYLHASNR